MVARVALEQQSLDNQAQRILQYTQGMLDQTVEVLHRLNAMRIDPVRRSTCG